MKNVKSRRWALLSLIVSCALVLGISLPAAAEEYPTFGQLISGGATGESPAEAISYTTISISTEEDLFQLAQDCELDVWSRDKYVHLENDIALKEYKNLMIPSFGGIFDGGGHKISGLEITAAGSALGLFRYIQDGGVVRSLSVSGKMNPEGSRKKAGILAGVNYGKIIDCSVMGSVAGAEEAGGIAGSNEATGEIRHCQSAAAVTGDHYTGGICGINKGILNNCTNSGEINTHSVEVAYSIEDITAENLEDINSVSNVAVHTDTGGITGYSEGKVYYCTNTGTVGYQHVGYNVGGIVGRLHQGYLQSCTNRGRVLGRKDVGGIAGQMEPFLEIAYLNDKLSEIDREVDVLFELLEAANEDLKRYGEKASELTKSIADHLKNASAAGRALTNSTNDLWYIYNQELTGISNDLNRLNQEWADQAEKDKENSKKDNQKAPGEGESPDGGNSDEGNSGGGNADDADSDEGDSDAGNSDGTDSDGEGVDEGDSHFPDKPWDDTDKPWGDTEKPWDDTDKPWGDTEKPWDDTDKPWEDDDWFEPQIDLESYIAALRRFGENTSTHLTNITSATNDRSGGIKNNLDILDNELESACDQLSQLSDVLGEGVDVTTADVDVLIEQSKVLRRSISELRDDLFRYEKITVEDASEEAAGSSQEPGDGESYYDTESFQRGKITLCLNEGTVEADTNVGGIVGQIATEFDFDPEDDISFDGAESFNIQQTVKAVVRESKNLGDVTGKKNYTGGIAGKADFGTIVSCESYGAVCSTGGSYVGGIAGSSDYSIRYCYAMGIVSGKNYVGGIVGRGSDVFYSYAYPDLDYSGECAGSIAGGLDEEGTIFGNYYVRGSVPGVDSIGYENGAMPLDYAEFSAREGVPETFSEFIVSFRADGKEIASIPCHYGEAIDREAIPEIPQKEGYYGAWPEFDYDCVTGNRVLEACYEKWITTLASEKKDESGRAMVLVQGEFLPEAGLQLEAGQEGGMRLSIPFTGEDGGVTGEYRAPVLVRVLTENAKNTIAEIWTAGGYQEIQCSVIGSYVEFSMEAPGTFRVSYQESGNKWVVIATCVGGVVVVLTAFMIGKMISCRKKRKAEK